MHYQPHLPVWSEPKKFGLAGLDKLERYQMEAVAHLFMFLLPPNMGMKLSLLATR